MQPEQMVDLVHYIRLLSSEEQREAAVLKRTKFICEARSEASCLRAKCRVVIHQSIISEPLPAVVEN